MKLLLTIRPQDVGDGSRKKYVQRWRSARAVLLRADGKVGLMYGARKRIYKLAGGGIERGESPRQTLRREMREETGCRVRITGELGRIIELRRCIGQRHYSYGYIATVVGTPGRTQLDADERHEQFRVVWLSPRRAREVMSKRTTKHPVGRYIVARDRRYLFEGLDLMANQQ